MNPNPQPGVPHKQPLKRRFSSMQLTTIIVIAVIFGSCALCGIIGGIGSYLDSQKSNKSNSNVVAPVSSPTPNSSNPVTNNSSSPSKSSTPRAYSTMVRNLAIIEGVQNDEAKISRIATLLSQLDERYPENEEQIGDMTAGAYSEIKKKGHAASIIGIMEAMMTVSEAKSGITYADAVTSYALLRVNGMQ